MTLSPTSSEHLRADDVTAFITSGPRGAHGAHIVAHLAECAACREEVFEVSRLVRPRAVPRPKPFALVAAAAGIALAAWFGLRAPALGAGEQRGTAGPGPGVQLVAPLGPVGREAPLSFSWRSARGAVEYKLTLLDEGGGVIWSKTTVDTVATLPIETSLVRGPSYYWFVDVLQADGSSATSGAREFRLTR